MNPHMMPGRPPRPRRPAPRMVGGRPEVMRHSAPRRPARSPSERTNEWLVDRALLRVNEMHAPLDSARTHSSARRRRSTQHRAPQNSNGPSPNFRAPVQPTYAAARGRRDVPLCMDDIQNAIAQVDSRQSEIRMQALTLLRRGEYTTAANLMAHLEQLQYSSTQLRSSFHDRKMARLQDDVLRRHVKDFRVDCIDELRESIAATMQHQLGSQSHNSTLEIAFERLHQYEVTLERFHRLLFHKMQQIFHASHFSGTQARLFTEELLAIIRTATSQGLSEEQVFRCIDHPIASIPNDIHSRILQVMRSTNSSILRRRDGVSRSTSQSRHMSADSVPSSSSDRVQYRDNPANVPWGRGYLARHGGSTGRGEDRGESKLASEPTTTDNFAPDSPAPGTVAFNVLDATSSNPSLVSVVTERSSKRSERRLLRMSLALMRKLCKVSENELARTLGLHSQTATSTVVTRPQQQFSVRILDEGFLVTIPPNHRSATVFDTAQQEDGFPQSYTLALVKDFPWFSKSPHSQHRLVLVAFNVEDTADFFGNHEHAIDRPTLNLVRAQLGKWVSPECLIDDLVVGASQHRGDLELLSASTQFTRNFLLLTYHSWTSLIGGKRPVGSNLSEGTDAETKQDWMSDDEENIVKDLSPAIEKKVKQSIHMAMGALMASGSRTTPLAVRKYVRDNCDIYTAMDPAEWNIVIRKCLPAPSPSAQEDRSVQEAVKPHIARLAPQTNEASTVPDDTDTAFMPATTDPAIDKSTDQSHTNVGPVATEQSAQSHAETDTKSADAADAEAADAADAEAAGINAGAGTLALPAVTNTDQGVRRESDSGPATNDAASTSDVGLDVKDESGADAAQPAEKQVVPPVSGLVSGMRLSLKPNSALSKQLQLALDDEESFDDVDLEDLERRLAAVKSELQDAHELNFTDEIPDLTWERDQLQEKITKARERGIVVRHRSSSMSVMDLVKEAAAEARELAKAEQKANAAAPDAKTDPGQEKFPDIATEDAGAKQNDADSSRFERPRSQSRRRKSSASVNSPANNQLKAARQDILSKLRDNRAVMDKLGNANDDTTKIDDQAPPPAGTGEESPALRPMFGHASPNAGSPVSAPIGVRSLGSDRSPSPLSLSDATSANHDTTSIRRMRSRSRSMHTDGEGGDDASEPAFPGSPTNSDVEISLSDAGADSQTTATANKLKDDDKPVPSFDVSVSFVPSPPRHAYKRGGIFSSKCKECGNSNAQECSSAQDTAKMMATVENESRAKKAIKTALDQLRRPRAQAGLRILIEQCREWLNSKHPSMKIAEKALADANPSATAMAPASSEEFDGNDLSSFVGHGSREPSRSRSLSRSRSRSVSRSVSRTASRNLDPLADEPDVDDLIEVNLNQENSGLASLELADKASEDRVDTPLFPNTPSATFRKTPMPPAEPSSTGDNTTSPQGKPDAASSTMNAAAAAAIAETRRRMSMRSARRSRTTSRAGKSLASDLPNRSPSSAALRDKLRSAGMESFSRMGQGNENQASSDTPAVTDELNKTGSEVENAVRPNAKADVDSHAVGSNEKRERDNGVSACADSASEVKEHSKSMTGTTESAPHTSMDNEDSTAPDQADASAPKDNSAIAADNPDKKAEEAKKADEEKKAAEEKRAEEEKKAEDEKKARLEAEAAAKAEADRIAARAAAIRAKKAAAAAATSSPSATTTTPSASAMTSSPHVAADNPSSTAAPSTGTVEAAVGGAPPASVQEAADGWLEAAVTVFPDWDRAGLQRFKAAGWTLQALVDYRKSNDPSWRVPEKASPELIAANGGQPSTAATAPTASPAPPAATISDLSDPADINEWVEKCATVFPDWEKSNLQAFRSAGWTIQALVDHRKSSDPSWKVGGQ